ncbi:uncharacterized protein LOC117113179 isoform X2 [Anneissia japonica]|uniref:uncharacterized protein LOC117113179 isoform X2 n=1 Tax=Anneissia japonica TaxID=1529436 RepID=UPI001425719C|nr:uncharacterized protein LOC117113179 isoform X2 [Anneissia japonica]
MDRHTFFRNRVFLIAFVFLILMLVDTYCDPLSPSNCAGGECKSNTGKDSGTDTDNDCVAKCKCMEPKETKQCLKCKKKCQTESSPVDSTTPVVGTPTVMTTTPTYTTATTEATFTTTLKSFSGNPGTQPNELSSATGMVMGAIAVAIVVIATSITCFLCNAKNQRLRREIMQSYEKRNDKEGLGGFGMIGNEAYSGTSLRGGMLSASASTLRVSNDGYYAKVEDDNLPDHDNRMSHCSLPDVMERSVDPTSGYAFYKPDRPSVYTGFKGHNKRAKNTSYGLHRIDRPTIYTGLKRDTNNRQPEENMSERVYAEAQEVLPERVLKGNASNENQTCPIHTYMKINEPNGPSTAAVATCPSAPPVDLDQSDTFPNITSPIYFQVENENEKHDYQMLLKNNNTKDGNEDFSEPPKYQSLEENISGGCVSDNQTHEYFTLQQ